MENFTYDILFVGAGITNLTIANIIAHSTNRPLKMLMIDRRDHIGGNCYTEKMHGIDVHKYGAHIFHTSDKEIADYVKQFGSWHNYINQPIAIYHMDNGDKRAFNMPFNMNTFVQLFPGCTTPEEVKAVIDKEIKLANIQEPKNLCEKAISLVGMTVFDTLIRGYTEKQWGCKCSELPPDIITRLPVRYTFDNNYFNDTYQMIPDNGYTEIMENMLLSCNEPANVSLELKLNTDFKDLHFAPNFNVHTVFYSGSVDELDQRYHEMLEYRSVEFVHEYFPECDNKQGCAVCNYTSTVEPYTRTIEHKWFNPGRSCEGTIVSKEYSKKWEPGIEPYYPVQNQRNLELYKRLSRTHYAGQWGVSFKRMLYVGRLGTYRYLDMDDSIMEAMKIAKYYLQLTNN